MISTPDNLGTAASDFLQHRKITPPTDPSAPPSRATGRGRPDRHAAAQPLGQECIAAGLAAPAHQAASQVVEGVLAPCLRCALGTGVRRDLLIANDV